MECSHHGTLYQFREWKSLRAFGGKTPTILWKKSKVYKHAKSWVYGVYLCLFVLTGINTVNTQDPNDLPKVRRMALCRKWAGAHVSRTVNICV
jgi:hypothetical protein